ncbi:aminotransferase class I/II-fold pyridoxal phosphate-dependent enzyme [Chitinophaga nivalis]|uniref:Aminotransferase class I/II-fold pyridoxal phosphate-dependent enzyme n=1 Tax=Chitinophaga nivalis TaxID=2991709 RepID=A0ABT3IR68_9BACT|nr:aminotransferase class I/II-fold pyridoxal phosphate-dependent enzyme [Chitinophaga nivalis]MCW3464060.1 aminotransferase class I/II-fold pyridoxal phosphate-dependent enzyme [Chitinophaga nivalis]MCW3486250.1 aminotransferase class I/II-fold pyridoxal phosphate-dependent enzyme [Chitinophaga nivalis]
MHTDITPGRRVLTADGDSLFFSGFSYLGLHQHPAFKAVLTTGIEKYGTLFPSSRAGNLRLTLYEETEHALAVLLQQQSAVVFSSGYLASQAAVHYGASCGQLLYAPEAHPSLWHHLPALPLPDREKWQHDTIVRINSQPDNTYVIAADAVNPLTATIHAFDWLQAINRNVLVIIDDSHGIGILGRNGAGSQDSLPENPAVRYLITASLAKAYSLEGGVVAGHAADIAALKRMPFFTASTPLMPANAYAWLQSAALIQTQRHLLQQNITHLRHLTADTTIVNPHALPMFLLPADESKPPLADFLAARQVVISSFAYPHPHSTPVNRAVVTALHLPDDLVTLHRHLQEYGI